MIRRRFTTGRRLCITALVALPAFGALAAGGASGALAASPEGSGYQVPASVQAKVLKYWTPARKAAAKDVTVIPAGPGRTLAVTNSAPEGGSGAENGAPPASLLAVTLAPEAPASPFATGWPGSYPYPHDTFPVTEDLYKTWPYELNGKIFFKNAGGNYVCSGTAIVNGHHANEVDTAGHCVANEAGTHEFDSEAEFVPAYNGNASTKSKREPFGSWVANYFYVANAWRNNGDVSADYGSMLVNQNKKHEELTAVVGSDGWQYGASDSQQFVQFGYPSEAPYTGNEMIENIAASAVTVNVGGVGPEPIGVGSSYTRGDSGGAWNIGFAGSNGPGRINGHNDFYYPESEPLTWYSPYYDSLWFDIHCLGKESEC